MKTNINVHLTTFHMKTQSTDCKIRVLTTFVSFFLLRTRVDGSRRSDVPFGKNVFEIEPGD